MCGGGGGGFRHQVLPSKTKNGIEWAQSCGLLILFQQIVDTTGVVWVTEYAGGIFCVVEQRWG